MVPAMDVIYQDEHFIAVNKPSGFHVHPPEDPRIRVPKEKICLYLVRDKIQQKVYPVHRLDAGTSGVLLFALSSDSAREMCTLFSERKTKKTYWAVTRGYTPENLEIQIPLELDSTGDLVEAHTSLKRLATLELPVAVGKKFPTARYSLVEVKPHTGRYHQIRRHLNRISHPLLGDAYHGDTRHNQFFRKDLKIEGLCLKALELSFVHPWTRQSVTLTAPDCEKWKKIQYLFNSDLAPGELLKSL